MVIIADQIGYFNWEEIQRITSPNDQRFWQNIKNPANACDGSVAIQLWFHQ